MLEQCQGVGGELGENLGSTTNFSFNRNKVEDQKGKDLFSLPQTAQQGLITLSVIYLLIAYVPLLYITG